MIVRSRRKTQPMSVRGRSAAMKSGSTPKFAAAQAGGRRP